jgi:hypothetical protein
MSDKYKKMPLPKSKPQTSTNKQTGATRGATDMKSAYMQEAMQKATEEQKRRAQAAEMRRRKQAAMKTRADKGKLGTAKTQKETEKKSLQERLKKYKKNN